MPVGRVSIPRRELGPVETSASVAPGAGAFEAFTSGLRAFESLSRTAVTALTQLDRQRQTKADQRIFAENRIEDLKVNGDIDEFITNNPNDTEGWREFTQERIKQRNDAYQKSLEGMSEDAKANYLNDSSVRFEERIIRVDGLADKRDIQRADKANTALAREIMFFGEGTREQNTEEAKDALGNVTTLTPEERSLHIKTWNEQVDAEERKGVFAIGRSEIREASIADNPIEALDELSERLNDRNDPVFGLLEETSLPTLNNQIQSTKVTINAKNAGRSIDILKAVQRGQYINEDTIKETIKNEELAAATLKLMEANIGGKGVTSQAFQDAQDQVNQIGIEFIGFRAAVTAPGVLPLFPAPARGIDQPKVTQIINDFITNNDELSRESKILLYSIAMENLAGAQDGGDELIESSGIRSFAKHEGVTRKTLVREIAGLVSPGKGKKGLLLSAEGEVLRVEMNNFLRQEFEANPELTKDEAMELVEPLFEKAKEESAQAIIRKATVTKSVPAAASQGGLSPKQRSRLEELRRKNLQ